MRDEKLVRVAVRVKQPVERVVWVWGALLESAAEINEGGRFEFDTGEAAYFLRCDDADMGSILAGLESLGRIGGGMVAKWGERQYDSDGAKERQRRYRERIKSKSDVQQRDRDHNVTQENVTRDVTQPSRDGEVTAQETDTDTDISDANASSCPEPEKSAPVVVASPTAFELPCVSGEMYPVSESDVAEWRASFPAVDVIQQLGAMRSWLIANPTRRKTRKGMRRFVVSWLDRKQNNSHSPPPAQHSGSPPGRHQTAVEANISRRIKRNEPAGGRFDNTDAELLSPDKPELRALVRNAGQAMRWPD
ncbi:hypothetical protein GCM10023067_04430 [Aminobacter aganoensis]